MKAPKLRHPGFQGAAQSIASREGLPMDQAKAILGAETRKAKRNPVAVRANPRLKRVRG